MTALDDQQARRPPLGTRPLAPGEAAAVASPPSALAGRPFQHSELWRSRCPLCYERSSFIPAGWANVIGAQFGKVFIEPALVMTGIEPVDRSNRSTAKS
jgi:hypothetical protein